LTNSYSFSQAEKIIASMSLPGWNTQASFMTENTSDFGQVGYARAVGSYLVYSSTHPDHVETLAIDIDVCFSGPLVFS
jgi:hypothetical protein